MAEQKRSIYSITRDSEGNAVSGPCSKCGRIFKFEDAADGGGRRVEEAFSTHECKREDLSQAAARIVREATEDH